MACRPEATPPRGAMPRTCVAHAAVAPAASALLGAALGSREAGRVALSARGSERGDADGPAEGDRTADLGAARRGLAAVGRVPQGEAGQLHGAENHPALDLQAGGGDPVVEARDLPIEPWQLALPDHVHEAGPRLPV